MPGVQSLHPASCYCVLYQTATKAQEARFLVHKRGIDFLLPAGIWEVTPQRESVWLSEKMKQHKERSPTPTTPGFPLPSQAMEVLPRGSKDPAGKLRGLEGRKSHLPLSLGLVRDCLKDRNDIHYTEQLTTQALPELCTVRDLEPRARTRCKWSCGRRGMYSRF